MNPLRIVNLTKTFPIQRTFWGTVTNPSYTAVDNVSFQVKAGEIVGLLGPGGAGKTSIIQMLIGTLTPTSGSIHYFGDDLAGNRPRIMQHIGYASSYVGMSKVLTVRENLQLYARLYRVSASEETSRIADCLELFSATELIDRPFGSLPPSDAARVGIAKAFLPKPKLIILDEPSATLDPRATHEIYSRIRYYRQQTGCAFLFSSHNMTETSDTCDRVLMLWNGQIIADDIPEELATRVATVRVAIKTALTLDEALDYLAGMGFEHSHQDDTIEIEVESQKIGNLLRGLDEAGVRYEEIEIHKPQLEDFFVAMAKHEGR